MTCNFNCNQGRNCACLRSEDGGESVDFTAEQTFRWIDWALSIAAVLILAAAVLGPLYWGVLQ